MLLDGANADATVDRSSFVKGSAYVGSAFSVINGASLVVSNSTVGEGNTTLNFSGGAVSVEGAASTTAFNNVTFADNRTDSTNGATFALDSGALPLNQDVANSIVQTLDPQNPNCTVSGATAAAFESGGHNIQFGGGSPDSPCAITPGPGDLTVNPLLPATYSFFAAAEQNGYLPLAGSPAIDGGLNCVALSGVGPARRAAHPGRRLRRRGDRAGEGDGRRRGGRKRDLLPRQSEAEAQRLGEAAGDDHRGRDDHGR